MNARAIGGAILVAITIGIAATIGVGSAVLLWAAAVAVPAAILLPIWLFERWERALWTMTALFALAAGMGHAAASWAVLPVLVSAVAIDWLRPA